MKQSPDWTALRILVIDRDLRFRFRLRGLLNHLGVAEILTTGDSETAIGLLGRYAFDVAVVDLAETGAMDFLRRVRAGGSPVQMPLLVLAENKDDYRAAVARGLGAEGVMSRPNLEAEAVLARIAEILLDPKRLDGPEREKPKAESVPAAKPRARAIPAHVKAWTPGAGKAATPTASGSGPAKAAGFLDDDMPTAEKAPNQAIELVERPPDEKPTPSFLELADDASEDGKAKKSDFEPPPAKKRRRPVDDGAPDAGPGGTPAAPEAEDDLPLILARHEEWLRSAGAQGERANLDGRRLDGISLEGALLADAQMKGAELVGANLIGADLHGADLRRAELLGARLAGCNLAVARLRHARMAGCDLAGASLKGADLAGADLAGAKFADADLTGANLLSTDLKGADLGRATGLTRAQAAAAILDAATVLPPGFGPLAAGPDEDGRS